MVSLVSFDFHKSYEVDEQNIFVPTLEIKNGLESLNCMLTFPHLINKRERRKKVEKTKGKEQHFSDL